MSLTHVWVVETGEYEERYVHSVALSPGGAVAGITSRYGPPYIVEWEQGPMSETGRFELVGKFARVEGLSTEHEQIYDIEPMPLVDACVPGTQSNAQQPPTET